MLWLLKRVKSKGSFVDGHDSYDTTHAVVVRASNERAARQLVFTEKATRGGKVSGDEPADVWTNEKLTTCERVPANGPTEVILTEYQAC